MKIKENRGISLITLVITVIVLAIIAGITVYSGLDVIKRANLESMRTNMLLIQAKAKEYVEEANFKMGPSKNESKIDDTYTKKGLMKIEESGLTVDIPVNNREMCYYVTTDALNQMGLSQIANELDENENYLVELDAENIKVEVYNTLGYEGKYSLTDLEEIQ